MAAHTHWRLRIQKMESPGGALQLVEMMFYDSSDNPLSTGGTAITNSSPGGANAFDNNAATSWVNSSGLPFWVGYIHPTPVDVSYVKITPTRAAGSNNLLPSGTYLEYSDDGTTWVTLGRMYVSDGTDITLSGSGACKLTWTTGDDPVILKNFRPVNLWKMTSINGPNAQNTSGKANIITKKLVRYSPHLGYRSVSGVVTINDIPGSRRVKLLTRADNRVVADTWSDNDGNYSFDNIPPGEYCVVGFDHTRSYNAVIQDMVVVV